jgi:hypothetical protein
MEMNVTAQGSHFIVIFARFNLNLIAISYGHSPPPGGGIANIFHRLFREMFYTTCRPLLFR